MPCENNISRPLASPVKQPPGLLTVLWGIILLFAGCSFPVGEDYRILLDDTGMIVIDYNLGAYVPVPVAGETPVKTKTIPARTDMDITVVWKDSAGADIINDFAVFTEGVVYQADITLTAMGGYAFDPEKPFTYREGTVESQTSENNSHSSSRTITVRYKPTQPLWPVDLTDLTPYSPAPVTGAAGIGYFTAPQDSGVVAWIVTGGAAHTGAFEGDTAYTATVTLTPNTGYKFAPDIVFTYTGGTIGSPVIGADGVTVTIDFAALPLVIQSFGSASATPNSARKLMMARKDDAAITAAVPLEIDLPAGSETVSPFSFEGTTSPAAVVINGGGRTLWLETGSTGSIISVGEGVTLTLRNISLRGLAANTAPLVTVAQGGTLILGDGAVIRDNTSSNDGGGAAVEAGGTLILDGGTITGNTAGSGGGVAVSGAGAQFTMENGTITGNFAKDGMGRVGGGGVCVRNGGNFTMEGGTILENRAQAQGGGIFVREAGTISISNAVIRNNTAKEGGGVAGYKANIAMQNSCIRDNVAQGGGGVYFTSDGTTCNFSMTGGEILGNTTTPLTPGSSGGVHLNNTTLTMAGAALIRQDDPVYCASSSTITIAGALTRNPAANFVQPGGSRTLLTGHVTTENNYTKFLVNGMPGKINGSGEYNVP
jgi:hypothetical protein